MTVMRGSKRTRRGDKRIGMYVEMKETIKKRGVRGRNKKKEEEKQKEGGIR